MKKNIRTLLAAIVLLGPLSCLFADEWKPQTWPVLKHYDAAHLFNIALPLGGIGTGTVSLGGRGEIRDWEIMNKPAKGFSTVVKGNNAPFFAIWVKSVSGASRTSGLMGPMDPLEYQHYEGRPINHHGLPRFRSASFDAAYPFGQVKLTDEKMPVEVTIKGFNPLIPGNADDSGIPIAVLTYEVANPTDGPLDVSVCGTMRNFIGADGSKTEKDWKGDVTPVGAKKNINAFRAEGPVRGIFMSSEGVPADSAAWGTIAMTTTSDAGVTFRRSSRNNDWENALLDFWDDFSADGELTDKTELVDDDPMASLAVRKQIPARSSRTFTFLVTWNFPVRYAWSKFELDHGQEIVGNYYSTIYKDAWDVAMKIVPRLPELEKKTIEFVNALLSSDYPAAAKEAALFNLAVLRSQTVFRLPDGHMFGWEGVMDENGSCFGSCTHVWNYEQATAFLFGDLARSMRDVELNYATDDNGKMSFRVMLPLDKARAWDRVAADGQMGCVMKLYREWQLSGDTSFLKKNYDKVKKVLAYAWIPGGWDGNQDGVMEGSQHNTMDVNYIGPNPEIGFWYMGALRAMSGMAKAMKDGAFAAKCDALFKKGSRWMDEHLFNGEYYEHIIGDPKTFEPLNWEKDPKVEVPDYQVGKGCLVDQLVGQYMAHICGLGYLAKPENMRTTLRSIMKYNFRTGFGDHFNNMRSYAMGDESGLLVASWPKGRLKVPFPYFSEVWTGLEYTAAAGMVYEGELDDALKVVQSARDRSDGRKRNPFSEPECGHHYARSMSSWALIPALSGFLYSGVDQAMTFNPKDGTYFWSNGYAYGKTQIASAGQTKTAEIEVLGGSVNIKKLALNGFGFTATSKPKTITAGEKALFTIKSR
jgi:non-lysosomal glucosylceramidase